MTKDLYELGDAPPLGTAPKQMYASLIRQERYGRPVDAFRTEVVDVPPVGPGQVLVKVMAAGVNYNNVWAALGEPLDVIAARQKQGATEDFHIGGSDLSGIVWAVGDGVRLKPGAEVVVLACRWDESAEDIRLGADPVTSSTQRVWGYEENYGSFAQFAVVDEYMCHPKPQRLSWAAASCYMATAATAYRQLFGWEPHTVRPGDPVLIWGGSRRPRQYRHPARAPCRRDPRGRGLQRGARRVLYAAGGEGVDRPARVRPLGPASPDTTDEEAMKQWLDGARAFGRRFWEVLGERRAPRIVLEHSGADTIPTSIYMADNAGMVVICGGTTGYNGDVDLRFLWMRQKRLQGSHVASAREAREITRLIDQGAIDPCLSRTFGFEEIGLAHQLIHDNQHPSGNMAVLVNATE